MKYEDKQKEIIINGKPFLLDSVFSDYTTQNIICTCYEHDEDGEGIRLALNWDHYFMYVRIKGLNYVIVDPLDPKDAVQGSSAVRLSQREYYEQIDDAEIKEHVYLYFTHSIEEALFVII